MNIGRKIKNLRLERGLSQEELAKKIGVSRESISHYENGRVIPPLDVLEAIAKEFDVSISYFLVNEKPVERINVNFDNASSNMLGFLTDLPQNFRPLKKVVEKPEARGIPVYRFSESNEDYPLKSLVYVRNIDSKFSKRFDMALRMNLDTLEPFIHKGALLLIKKIDKPQNGDLILYKLNGSYDVRWYIRKPGLTMLAAENRKYSDIVVRITDDFYIKGIVVGIYYDLKPHKEFL